MNSHGFTEQFRQFLVLARFGRQLWIGLLLCLGSLGHAQTIQFRQTSVPVGIVNQTSTPAAGSVVSTVTAPFTSGAYTFAFWTFNGAIVPDTSGAAANPAVDVLTENTDAVAIYLPTALDSDTDGLPDWWEQRYFHHLDETGATNPDGDAFDNAAEYARGQSPVLFNHHAHGGISRRRTPVFTPIQNREVYALLTEASTPAGAVQQTRVVTKGVPIALTNPPASISGYQFTGWLLDGVRYDQPSDFQPITVTPTGDMTFVARYVLATEDGDADGLLDWKEWLWFDSLQYDNSSDPDGDGFTIAEEQARTFSNLAADALLPGGLSRRRSPSFYVDTTGRLSYLTISDPATILNDQQYLAAGSAITVPDRNGQTFANYRFCWWDMNGTRQQDASGVAVTTFSFTLNTPTTVTGHYVDPTVDSIGDGIKDWTKMLYYGSLANGAATDTDGDGFTFAEELARGFSPRVADTLDQGGLSRRRSPAFFVDTTGRLSYRTVSDPASILSDQQYLPAGTVISVPDKNGHTLANYRFCWWDLNGVRQQDASGVAVTAFTFTLNTAAIVTGHYLDPAMDSIGDGITDWTKTLYYNSLANGAGSDTDGDGFTFAEELKRGFSPRVVDTLEHGGLSRRRGVTFTIAPVLDPTPPEVGALYATNVTQNSARISALVNPMSAATSATFQYGADTGSTVAYPSTQLSTDILNGFSAAPMSALLTNLQPSTTYHFRVVATNALGTTTSVDATFRTLPGLTPLQQWSLSYGVGGPTEDDDHDGVRNVFEYALGLNPGFSNDSARFADYAVIELINGRYVLRCSQPFGVTGITYGAQYSLNLTDWIDLPDQGTAPAHFFITPIEMVGTPRIYVRWKISVP